MRDHRDQPTQGPDAAEGELPEWRRPWRGSETPSAVASGSAAHDPSAPIAGQAGAHPSPQPPPSGWDDTHDGPGSPYGSIRPPDTTVTADVPAGAGRRGAVARDDDRRTGRRPVAAALLGALVGSVLGTAGTLVLVGGVAGLPEERVRPPVISPEGDDTGVVAAVAEAVTPSVVRIDVEREGAADNPLEQGGLGSGVVYREDGYILTNHHVIEGADLYQVRLANGDVLEGELVGSDELSDLAVLKVDREGLPAVDLRKDDPVRVGETAIAIGSPFGLDASVTVGVVSALDRELFAGEQEGATLTIPSVIQTDAAINPGNSGGALVDSQGRLIGINTAIASRTGGGQGVGFAVSAEQAVTSAEQLIDQGFVRHPLLGVTGTDVSPDVADELGLERPRGALIDSVAEDTGADEAGLEPADVIIAIDGQSLATMSDLVAEVRRRQPGDVVELTVVRDEERLTVDVELGERPRSESTPGQ